MAASFGKVFLLGNLSRDPDFSNLKSGTALCKLSIAVNRTVKEREEVCFVDVTVWGKSAENCRNYLSKGSQVFIEGHFKQESWEDRNGGGKRYKLTVEAETIQFLSKRNSNSSENSATQYQTRTVSPEYNPQSQYGSYTAEPTQHDIDKSNGYQPQPTEEDIPF